MAASKPLQRKPTIVDPKLTFNRQRTNSHESPYGLKHSVTMAKAPKKNTKQKQTQRPKPQVTKELLKGVVYSVFAEADEDGNDNLDLNECRVFL